MATLKKKVTLRTKVSEIPTNNQQINTTSIPVNKGNGKGKWFGIVASLVTVVIVAFFLLKSEKSDEVIMTPDDTIPQHDLVTAVETPVQQSGNDNVNAEIQQSVTEYVMENETIERNDNSDNVIEDCQVENVITDNTQKENIVSDKNNETDNSNTTISQQNNTLSTTESKTILPKESNLTAETIEAKAWLVIRGDFGNGKERKMKLGSDYSVIQNKVNELYKNGLVH